ncbi:MAG: fumarylacetoacetase, partial [Planctomycetota bacterium]|nr:fumarylacetoacetase [Planctomycetota bacterium]
MNTTNDPARRSWVESANDPGTDFPIQNLPFGLFTRGEGDTPRIGVAIGDQVLDCHELVARGLLGSDAPARVRDALGA